MLAPFLLALLELNLVALDLVVSTDCRRSRLDCEEVLEVPLRYDVFELCLVDSLVEEVAELGDNDQGHEVHDKVHDLLILEYGNQVDDLYDDDGDRLQEPSEVGLLPIEELPRMVGRIFHHAHAHQELALQRDMHDHAAYESCDDDQ